MFDVPLEHIVQSSSGKGWRGVDIAEIIHPLDDFALPPISRHVLVVHLSAPAVVSERRAGRHAHLGPGGLVILPAGAPSAWHLEHKGEVRHLHLYLAPAWLQQMAAEADLQADSIELIPTIGDHDPQIEALALAFLAELRVDGLGSKLYRDSLATLLAIHLLRRHSSAKLPAIPSPRGLPQATTQRVIAYIEEQLADDLPLADLAAVANLSPYHFARLFKAGMGCSPHQYVLQRRVERARLLLTTTNWSLSAIAHATGFASESHLALHFRRLTGLTPKQYR
jgi:AraC family transcriptional regulator